MKAALLMAALLGGPPALIDVPVPEPVPVQGGASEGRQVLLSALLDRHLAATDSFQGAGGRTSIAGTLDLVGDGYVAVTPPGAGTRFVKMERGMSDAWSDGVHAYRISLSVSILRARLNNVLVVKDVTTGRVVWEKKLNELFRLTYAAGEPVTLGGRPYRLFYSARPALGLCFIYDEVDGGKHEFKFYMVPLEQLRGAAPTSYKMYGGDVVRLLVSPDMSTLQITR